MAKVISASSPLAFGQNPLLNAAKAALNQLSGSTIGYLAKTSANDLGVGAKSVAQKVGINNPFGTYHTSGFSSSGSGGGGSSAAGGGSSGFAVKNGQVQFANPDMQKAMQMIQQTVNANNAWSAEQAQKQMDFQKMMSDTAHQREVADLQAAGLNPVLSAGGSGASTPSGAMAQTDDSNTRLIGELAMAAIDAVSNTALGVSAATSKNSGLLSNYFVRRALGAGSAVAGATIARKAVGGLLAAF